MSDTVQSRKVLVVDDDHSIHVLLYSVFREHQLSVIAATRLGMAEKALRSHQFDLVIADIDLRGILASEGLELLSFVKRYWPRTCVVIMSGLGSPDIRQEAIKRGADYYLDKPFDLAEIQKIVEDISPGAVGARDGTGGEDAEKDPARRRFSDHSSDVPDGAVAV